MIETRLVVDTTSRISINCVNLRNSCNASDLRCIATSALDVTAA